MFELSVVSLSMHAQEEIDDEDAWEQEDQECEGEEEEQEQIEGEGDEIVDPPPTGPTKEDESSKSLLNDRSDKPNEPEYKPSTEALVHHMAAPSDAECSSNHEPSTVEPLADAPSRTPDDQPQRAPEKSNLPQLISERAKQLFMFLGQVQQRY